MAKLRSPSSSNLARIIIPTISATAASWTVERVSTTAPSTAEAFVESVWMVAFDMVHPFRVLSATVPAKCREIGCGAERTFPESNRERPPIMHRACTLGVRGPLGVRSPHGVCPNRAIRGGLSADHSPDTQVCFSFRRCQRCSSFPSQRSRHYSAEPSRSVPRSVPSHAGCRRLRPLPGTGLPARLIRAGLRRAIAHPTLDYEPCLRACLTCLHNSTLLAHARIMHERACRAWGLVLSVEQGKNRESR